MCACVHMWCACVDMWCACVDMWCACVDMWCACVHMWCACVDMWCACDVRTQVHACMCDGVRMCECVTPPPPPPTHTNTYGRIRLLHNITHLVEIKNVFQFKRYFVCSQTTICICFNKNHEMK